MKTALLVSFCSLAFVQALSAQNQPAQTREPQDLQLSKGRQPAPGNPPANWPPAGPTPHTADGHPDLSGNWQPNAIRENVDLIGSGVDVPFVPRPKTVYEKHQP